MAADTHALGEEKTAKNPSPCVLTSFPAWATSRGPDQGVMFGEDRGVSLMTETLQQLRRALDVGEQEGERVRGNSIRGRPAASFSDRGLIVLPAADGEFHRSNAAENR